MTDYATASTEEIVAASATMKEEDIREVMSSAARERVLEALIEHMVAGFKPEGAQGIDAVLHVKVWDKPDGGYDHYEIIIHDGTCVVSAPPAREPDLTLKAGPADLHGLITGRTGPRRLAMRGKLRVVGDLGLGLKLPNMFTLGS